MPTELKFRGGTTTQTAAFTGANKEVTVDTTKKTLVVHDGSTAGGHELARADLSNVVIMLPDLADIQLASPINGQALVYDSTASKWKNSTISALSSLTDVTLTSPASGQILKYDGTKWINGTDNTGSGAGLASRSTVTVTTASLAAGAAGTYTLTGFKGYALLSIEVNNAAWVTVYTSTAARTADSSRAVTTDPTPGSGVIAEAVTAGAGKVSFTPGVFGFNDETSPTTDIPIKVVNQSGATGTVDVTLTLLQMEA